MKKLVQIQELDGQGFEALMGKQVFFFCTNYNYYGTLVGVNKDDLIIENAGIVFDSGSFDKKGFNDIQKFPCKEWRLRTSYIESYGEMTEV